MAKLDWKGALDSRPCSSTSTKANQGSRPSQKLDGLHGGVESRPKSSPSSNDTRIKGKGATGAK